MVKRIGRNVIERRRGRRRVILCFDFSVGIFSFFFFFFPTESGA